MTGSRVGLLLALMNELLGLPYSPWTEKARWALDARRVPYVFRHYQPLIGEPALRLKTRRWTGPASVPVLTTSEGRAIEDSAAIARWADGFGDGPTLFPPEHAAEIDRYVALSESALAAGRALSLPRLLKDEDALVELLPPPLRRFGSVAKHVSAFGIRRTVRKYGADARTPEQHRATLAAALDEVKSRLDVATGDGPRTLLGRFTFADVAMVQVLINIEPPPDLKIGKANRRSFPDPVLRERYQGLLAWRDELTKAFRRRA